MPSAGRNAFSEEDDTLLLEYLAVFSTAEERKGNRVYKQLTDNISGHWPWSSRHPWQSWRHRYIREPDYFDRKIRNHLRHKRQAETLIGDQAPTSQVSEATSKESRPQKRKTSSVVENRKEEKRRRIEPDSLPQTKAPKKNTVSTKDTGPIKQRRKDKEESVVPNLDFVPISQFTRRAPILSEGKGEGPSRSRQPSRQFKAVLATDNSEFGSDADSSKHYSYLPSLSKDRNTLVPPRPNTTLPEKGGDSKKSPPHHSPPGSDDYMGELFGESSNSLEDEIAREMELDPEADQENDENEDLEVNHMLTDPMNTDTYMSQGKPASRLYPSIESIPVASSSKQPSYTSASRNKNSKLPQGPAPVAGDPDIFESSPASASSDPPRLLPPPKPVPQLVESPFGGTRYKQPRRRKAVESSSSESESKPKKTPSPSWPPARGKSKRAIVSQNGQNPVSSPSAAQIRLNGHTPSVSPKGPPRRSARKEPLVISDRGNRESSVDSSIIIVESQQEQEPLFTQPSQPRARNVIERKPSSEVDDEEEEEINDEPVDDEEEKEPLFTQPQSLPTSPPRSSQLGTTTEAVSSDGDEAPPAESVFTQAASVPLPDSPHTPKRRSPEHPFNNSGSRRGSSALDRSGGVAKQLVSRETADSVIKALKTFLSEMNRNMNQQAEREAQNERGSPRMVVDKRVFRERGSPVRTGTKKRNLTSVGPEGGLLVSNNTRAAHSSPSDRMSNSPAQEDKDDLQEHSDSSAPREMKSNASSGQIEHIHGRVQRTRPPASPAPAVVSNSRGTYDSHKSGRADGLNDLSASPSNSSHKGKNKEVEVPGPSKWQDPSNTASDSKLVDLRNLARTQRRKSSRPSMSISSSAVSLVSTAQVKSVSPSSTSSNSTQSPLKLSVSDQSRLIDREIQNMAEQYDFPPEYVRKVWKRAGSMDKAVAVLARLKDEADFLLNGAGERHSPSASISGAGRRRGGGVFPRAIASSPPDRSSSVQGQLSKHFGETTEVRQAADASRTSSASRESSLLRRRSRMSFGDRSIFKPTILDRPIPSSGYSPPTHSRAGQVVLLYSQGRLKEAVEKEKRRATWGSGVFNISI